jgi:hypothetical protein
MIVEIGSGSVNLENVSQSKPKFPFKSKTVSTGNGGRRRPPILLTAQWSCLIPGVEVTLKGIDHGANQRTPMTIEKNGKHYGRDSDRGTVVASIHNSIDYDRCALNGDNRHLFSWQR